MPKTSLIIPTFDRQKITFDTLVYLNNQTIKDFEVIVIDQTKSVSKDLENFSFSNGITVKAKTSDTSGGKREVYDFSMNKVIDRVIIWILIIITGYKHLVTKVPLCLQFC